MRRLNSICKIYPDSVACDHWQREICTRCPNAKIGEDRNHIHSSNSPDHKLITIEDCQRLQRELQAPLFNYNPAMNSMTFLLIFLSVALCIGLIIWLLARAFVLKNPPPCPDDCVTAPRSDRHSGGQTSKDGILQQMQDKCFASTKGISNVDKKALYVPSTFWDRFSIKGPKSLAKGYEFQVNESEETSDVESSAYQTDEFQDKSTDEETFSTTSDLSEKATALIDQSSITMSIQSEPHKCDDSIGKMPTTYEPISTTQSNTQGRGNIRWANWLRRGKQNDYQV